MSRYELLIEVGRSQMLEYQYDPSSCLLFASLYDEDGHLQQRKISKKLTNPIPLMIDRMEKFMEGALESLD